MGQSVQNIGEWTLTVITDVDVIVFTVSIDCRWFQSAIGLQWILHWIHCFESFGSYRRPEFDFPFKLFCFRNRQSDDCMSINFVCIYKFWSWLWHTVVKLAWLMSEYWVVVNFSKKFKSLRGPIVTRIDFKYALHLTEDTDLLWHLRGYPTTHQSTSLHSHRPNFFDFSFS